MCGRLSFDIWGNCSEDSDMSSIPTGRRSSRHVWLRQHVRYCIVSRPDWDLLCTRYEDPVYRAYYNKASQSRSRLTVMHYSGLKSFTQYQYELDCMIKIRSQPPAEGSTPLIDDDIYDEMLASDIWGKVDELCCRMPPPPTFDVLVDAYDQDSTDDDDATFSIGL
ncbi:hypothetical protein COCNU_scaffold000092G000020 [Cocos nucifera]|nr:hypothetical protein [Cocos nucifera]